MLNGETRSAPTLCVTDGHEVIPLNTPDGRPIQMNKANAISLVMGNGYSRFSSRGGSHRIYKFVTRILYDDTELCSV